MHQTLVVHGLATAAEWRQLGRGTIDRNVPAEARFSGRADKAKTLFACASIGDQT